MFGDYGNGNGNGGVVVEEAVRVGDGAMGGQDGGSRLRTLGERGGFGDMEGGLEWKVGCSG